MKYPLKNNLNTVSLHGDMNQSLRTKSLERFKDKSVYIGEFDNNEITGIGSKTYANGKIYKGQWKIGMYHGRGTLKFSKNDHYNGSFRNSLFHGQGKRTCSSLSNLHI